MKLNVSKVTCLEDRAQVERSGEAELPKGLHRLVIDDVALVAVDRSLKVEAKGAKVIDAKIERAWKEQPKGGLAQDASVLAKRAHDFEQQAREAQDEVARLSVRRELVLKTRTELYRGISEGAGAGKSDTATWSAQLERVSNELEQTDEALRRASENLAWVKLQAQQARAARDASEERVSKLKGTLAITVESEGGKVSLRASYLVPCAVWRPAYRATLSADSVRLEAEAVVWQRTGEAWNDVELVCSTARPTLGASPPQLSPDRLSLRTKQEQEKRQVDVSVREEEIQNTGAGNTKSAEMPGLDDGGEARLLRVQGRVTVPSDGQPHRLPLYAFESKANIERVAAPELSPLVSLVAKFANSGPQVLLAGPVDLIRQSGFIGRNQLKFAAQGETVALSFGTDDVLRVVRNLQEKVEEARLTGRRTRTKTVKLFVSNAGSEPVKLAIEERIPVSEVKEVEVQVLQKDSKPAPKSISKDGIARLEVDLPAFSQQEAKFSWELSAASKVAGI